MYEVETSPRSQLKCDNSEQICYFPGMESQALIWSFNMLQTMMMQEAFLSFTWKELLFPRSWTVGPNYSFGKSEEVPLVIADTLWAVPRCYSVFHPRLLHGLWFNIFFMSSTWPSQFPSNELLHIKRKLFTSSLIYIPYLFKIQFG